MNNRNQLEFLDLLSIASFCIGLMNLDENITQGDMQDLAQNFNIRAETILEEIHGHLEMQDAKLNEIQKAIKELREQ
jgi:hypothetical protein